ncbi:MAG: hypothetical protein WCR55_01680 [Lentisphaerota bacterium]
MIENPRKLIMIMVDGFGIPPEGWGNSVFARFCSSDFIALFENNSIPLDATLEMAGIPQSATGQTAIFTGLNASKLFGSHLSGFPGPFLKSLLCKSNIFLELIKLNKSVIFANSYARYPLEKIINSRFASVTSVMLSTFSEQALNTEDMLNGNAVFHDITRRTIAEKFGLSTISPEDGAKHLLNISSKYDFTLFEYFLTDKAGHSRDEAELKITLEELSRFILELTNNLPKDTSLLICSDHGNCEDIGSKQHTINFVPLLLINIQTSNCQLRSITDIHNLIINHFKTN